MASKAKPRTKLPAPATIQARVDELLAIHLDGANVIDMRHFVAEKVAAGEPPWRVPDDGQAVDAKTLAGYVAEAEKARDKVTGRTEGNAKDMKAHLAKRRNLYAKAVSQGDVRAALSCLRDEATLLGLYDKKKPTRKPSSPALDGPNAIAELLAGTVADLQAGRIDPRTATTIGALAAMLLKAKEGDAEAKEARELLGMAQQERGEA